ncbi:hypothetical protein [Flavobacterium capsici]|uniref:Uncharacterized protein n=1 Tax=Flavobacterium capsici TaxID=3075618 RepID=A0AA96F138_9FLAO|nr:MULTISPECIES: hypothetical protein [unclassified Flavobacterium]WNM19250.1 hypothetical protein RN608_00875 [Flavobacterium sp. PMR2A8]WNM20639.1 hypothetical protein RN605_08045 [Flavobacterium sp. PMTSA4]
MDQIEVLYNELCSSDPFLRAHHYHNLDEATKEKLNLFSSIKVLERNFEFYSKNSTKIFETELKTVYKNKIKSYKEKLQQLTAA